MATFKPGDPPAQFPEAPFAADLRVNDDFAHFVRTRFVLRGDKVSLLPDPLGGSFTVSLTPEQAEFLSRYLAGLASAARADRAVKYPLLYPEDAADSFQVRTDDARD